jgi:eukaryotic-like serine/threonine-protein kinase
MSRALAGRYHLVRPLAKGGMAEVWEGRDEVLSRPVAVKMLLAHLAADPHLRERFRREAITAARLVHPGIVATFDAGLALLGESGATTGQSLSGAWSRDDSASLDMAWPGQASTAFIVMELVPGETLRDLMARACPLSPEVTVAIITQVADALAYAHAQGLVHRDIKPANVLLRDEGGGMVRVKVADFGIAKAAAAAGGDLTASGTVLGTPKYLAPEQVQGNEPDARADLYSVGVVLFEMLAGEAPFKGTTDMATALAHVQQPAPRVDQVRPGLPPGLADLVDALLVKDPEKRVPSALVLGGTLTSIRKSLGVQAQIEPGAYLYIGPGAVSDRPRAPGATATPAPPGTPREVGRGEAGLWPSDGSGPAQGGHEPAVGGPGVVAGAGMHPESGPGSVTVAAEVSAPEPGPSTNGKAKGEKAPGKNAPDKKAQDKRHAKGLRRRRRRIAGVAVATLLVAGGLTVAALLRTNGPPAPASSGSDRSGTTLSPQAGNYPQLSILSVHELTQNGNLPNDNLNELSNVVDGNSATSWDSSVYLSPRFGGYGGFGLVLQLSDPRVLHELVVDTTMQDWSAQTFTGDAFAQTVSGWGRPTETLSGLSGNAAFSLGNRKASWVLFWMTDPGPTRQAEVEELTVR